jgi:hypothetical protein
MVLQTVRVPFGMTQNRQWHSRQVRRASRSGPTNRSVARQLSLLHEPRPPPFLFLCWGLASANHLFSKFVWRLLVGRSQSKVALVLCLLLRSAHGFGRSIPIHNGSKTRASNPTHFLHERKIVINLARNEVATAAGSA